MKRMFVITAVFLTAAVFSDAQDLSEAEKKEGFRPLFDGKSFDGWNTTDKTPKSWKIEGGMLMLTGGSSHLFTKDNFEDFILRLEWRPAKNGYNSGIFIRGNNQLQMQQQNCGMLMSNTKETKGVPKLHKAPGEWNAWEVVCIGSKVALKVNGTLAWEIDTFKAKKGTIGIEAEGHAIDFKHLRIKVIEKAGQKDPPQKQAKKGTGTFLDPKDAGSDYEVQGEYVGALDGGAKLGCQIIALGNGNFQALLLPGGLPGDGWDGQNKILMDGKLDGVKAVFIPTTGKRKYMAGPPGEFSATASFPPKAQKDYSGVLAEGTLSGKSDDGKAFSLNKVTRVSPTFNAKAPEGAIILFDGSNANEWKEGKIVDGLLPVAANSKRSFKDFKLHIEFRTPFQPTARSQGRGNSGVYLHGKHEIQVLDSFGLEGKNNECGGFYGRTSPSVNMCYPPLAWQTYDVEFKTGPADPNTKKQTARVTVLHNGVKIHDNLEFPSGEGPLHLQNHGNPVFYRNIWVMELK